MQHRTSPAIEAPMPWRATLFGKTVSTTSDSHEKKFETARIGVSHLYKDNMQNIPQMVSFERLEDSRSHKFIPVPVSSLLFIQTLLEHHIIREPVFHTFVTEQASPLLQVMCQYNVDRWIEETRITIEPNPVSPGPDAPNTDWRIPINRQYYAQFPLPPNTIPREPLPFPGPPHPSRPNVPLRPLNWRRGHRLPIVPIASVPGLPITRLERLDTPGHFLHSIDTVMSSPSPDLPTARPPQTPRANSWPPADLTPTVDTFTHNISTPPGNQSGSGASSNSSPHPGSYISGMSIEPLTPLPTPGMTRRNALPVHDPGLPDTPLPRHDSHHSHSDDEDEDEDKDSEIVTWTDEALHGVADFDEGDIERARHPVEEERGVSPKTRPSRFVELWDVSAPEGYFDDV